MKAGGEYQVLSLFAGIGGFDLGLERTGGFRTVAFCEIDEFCRKVLAKHWPGVPCYDDVCNLTADRLAADGIFPSAIVGGFPCQDISVAGEGAGLDGARSGLWSEFARLIGELRPRVVIVENVAALLSRGMGDVLGDLAALGYGAEWHCIPASDIGAPHRRDRVWIVAYPDADSRGCEIVGKPEHAGFEGERRDQLDGFHSTGRRDGEAMADAVGAGLEGLAGNGAGRTERPQSHGPIGAACLRIRGEFGGGWETESRLGRVADGIPGRVDRLRSLGNAVVPQIPEMLGWAILEARP